MKIAWSRAVAAPWARISAQPAPPSSLAPASQSWARIGEHVGQRDLKTTADTYTHVLVDETEVDYDELLAA